MMSKLVIQNDNIALLDYKTFKNIDISGIHLFYNLFLFVSYSIYFNNAYL